MQMKLLYFVVSYYCLLCTVVATTWNMSMFSLETKAEEAKCKPSEFKCDLSKCIKSSYLCDDIKDCFDGSDESYSTCKMKTICPKPQFQCKSRFGEDEFFKCLKHTLRCNGKDECPDGSDETDCPKVPICKGFTCSTGRCIPTNKVCDGTSDCKYGEDEAECPFRCKQDLYRCGQSLQCVNKSRICDDSKDCLNGADETDSCHIDECYSKRKRCDHNCHDKPIGYYCTCNEGYKLSDDLHSCKDINECEIPGSCSQLCYNTEGSFSCGCIHGYQLTNETKCTAIGKELFFIIAISEKIFRVDVNKSPPSKELLGTASQIGAMSYLASLGIIYFSDLYKNQIIRVSLFNPNKLRSVIVNAPNSEGLAVDWIAYKLYWSERSMMKVAGLNGEDATVLVRKTRIKGLAIDPRKGHRFIYWCSWDTDSTIEKMSLDGDNSTRRTIHSQHRSKPKNLVIDFTTNQLFWLDAQYGTIGSRYLSGGFIFYKVEPIPISITVFEDMIYWIGNEEQSVHVMNKLSGVNKTLSFPMKKVNYLFVFQEQLQPKVDVPKIRPQCTHLRLLSHKHGYKCVCPAPLQLLSDGETCNTLDAVSCHKDYCYHGGVCMHESNGGGKTFPKCLCPADFNGTRCETRIELFQPVFRDGRIVHYSCVDDYCYNQGICVEYTANQPEKPLKPKCSCPRGYYGDRCEYYYGYMLDPMQKGFAAVYATSVHVVEKENKNVPDSVINMAVGLTVLFVVISLSVIMVTNRLTKGLPKYDVDINPVYASTLSEGNEDQVFLNTDLITILSAKK